jgi:hypothetical protein
VHVHLLALDGVYIEDERGELGFQALDAPSSAEVADIAGRTARRVHQAFKKKGRPSPWDQEHALGDSGEADPLSIEQPGLFACYQAAAAGIAVSGERAGQPVLRLLAGGRAEPERGGDNTEPSTEPVAEVFGVNLYAKQQVDGHDRQQLERLCRYVMRPPLSQERLHGRTDGRLEAELKNVRKDGTRALVLEPEDLLVRLCACVPPPWFNLIRYFGVLSSHSRHRARVVPSVVEPPHFAPEAAAGDQLDLGFTSAFGASARYARRPSTCVDSVQLAPGTGSAGPDEVSFPVVARVRRGWKRRHGRGRSLAQCGREIFAERSVCCCSSARCRESRRLPHRGLPESARARGGL